MLSPFHNSISKRCIIALLMISLGLLPVVTAPVHADHILPLHLAAKPFSPTMCKGYGPRASIRILIANHRDLVLKRIPGQQIPPHADEARQKNYVHYITLADLTNSKITHGAIAFDSRHNVIFDESHPSGVSRPIFVSQQASSLRPLVNQALNTFLHIHQILNAAIDTCRPYPTKIAYETDDEILRIERGKHIFRHLVQRHNQQPTLEAFTIRHEPGNSKGFVDPDAGKHSNMSYHAMNPLNFYVSTSYP